jgi:hypothetical protein
MELSSWIHNILPVSSIENVTWKDVIISVCASLILTTILFAWFPVSEHNPVQIYKSMADEPFHFHEFPYGARILTPIVASVMPFDLDTNFRWIAFISFVICGFLISVFLRLFDISITWSILLLPGLYFSPTLRFLTANPWYGDPMSFWIMMVLFIAALSGNIGLAMGSLSLNQLNRPESIVGVLLLVPAWMRKRDWWKTLCVITLCTIPPLVIFVFFRQIWPLVSDAQLYSEMIGSDTIVRMNPQKYWLAFQENGFSVFIRREIYQEILPYSWGLVFVGFLYSSWRLRLVCIIHTLYTLLPMIIAMDTFRLPFYLFPVFILLSGIGLKRLNQHHSFFACCAIGIYILHCLFLPKWIVLGVLSIILWVGLDWYWKKYIVDQ